MYSLNLGVPGSRFWIFLRRNGATLYIRYPHTPLKSRKTGKTGLGLIIPIKNGLKTGIIVARIG